MKSAEEFNGVGRVAEPPLWKVWENPIVRRYARARLRKGGFIGMAITVLVIAGFMFFVGRAALDYRTEVAPADVARGPLLPLFFLQGLIIFLIGTGNATGAIVQQKDEGIINYQYLSPKTAVSKVIGYLFGVSIREWVLLGLTMPFALWSLWEGQVPLWAVAQLYCASITAALMYHLTGIVAGTVMKNKRVAFLGSIGLICFLYTFLPQVSKLGLAFLDSLTVFSVGIELLPEFLPEEVGKNLRAGQKFVARPGFMGTGLSSFVSTMVAMWTMILLMGNMVWRRWRNPEAHLMGKGVALLGFVWFAVMLLGHSIPLIDSGQVFPSRGLEAMFSGARFFRSSVDVTEALIVMVVSGALLTLVGWILLCIVTPKYETSLRGWRRAQKLGEKRLAWNGDASSAWWLGVVLTVLAAGTWFIFAREIFLSRHFPEYELTDGALVFGGVAFLLSFVIPQMILEWKGMKGVGILLLVSALPLMLGVFLGVVDEKYLPAVVWLCAASPLTWVSGASLLAVPPEVIEQEVWRPLSVALPFWLAVFGCFGVWLAWRTLGYRKGLQG